LVPLSLHAVFSGTRRLSTVTAPMPAACYFLRKNHETGREYKDQRQRQ
jgi:phage portal protein BeeE